jgi:N-acetylglutamate synthase/N-acetylornithine aminotransferase
MGLVGRDLPELGLDHIDASEFAGQSDEVELSLRLGRGDHTAHVWFSDLGYEYVRINAEYTT